MYSHHRIIYIQQYFFQKRKTAKRFNKVTKRLFNAQTNKNTRFLAKENRDVGFDVQ